MREEILFENRLRIWLPENFSPMPEPIVTRFYPFPERPQIVFSNADNTRFLTFSLLKKGFAGSEALPAAREIRKMVWSLYPSTPPVEAANFSLGKLACAGFSFQLPSENGFLFSMLYVASLGKRMLLGTFGCPTTDQDGKLLLRKLVADAEAVNWEDVT